MPLPNPYPSNDIPLAYQRTLDGTKVINHMHWDSEQAYEDASKAIAVAQFWASAGTRARDRPWRGRSPGTQR